MSGTDRAIRHPFLHLRRTLEEPMPTNPEPHRTTKGGARPLPRVLLVTVVSLGVAVAAPSAASAQVRPTPPPIPPTADATLPGSRVHSPVYIAIPDEFPPIEARAMVVREPGIDLVVLREGDADLDALTMALHVLRDARTRLPAPTSGVLLPITGFVVTSPVSKGDEIRLTETLRRLNAAETVNLGSLGPGRRTRLAGR